jgi:hypothetical protein
LCRSGLLAAARRLTWKPVKHCATPCARRLLRHSERHATGGMERS